VFFPANSLDHGDTDMKKPHDKTAMSKHPPRKPAAKGSRVPPGKLDAAVKPVKAKRPYVFERFTQADWDEVRSRGDVSHPGGDLTVHHLFPRKVLAEFVESPDEANKPANYALLSRPTNSEFGDKRPDDVWAALTPDQRKLAASQFFGEAAGDRLMTDRYKEFCQWRADRLVESMNDWLGID
jgi:hypothetical protein